VADAPVETTEAVQEPVTEAPVEQATPEPEAES
jgi:hypothetical protein